jgi:thiol-disulfide isomerase/thioredoxin
VRRVLVCVAALWVLGAACGGGGTADPGPGPSTDKLEAGTPDRFDDAIRSLRGKPVVVNFWATWCGPCKTEMPRLVSAANTYKGRVHFLGVDVQDDARSAAEFIREYDIPFRNLSDPDGKIRNAQRLVGLPETQFYAADGELAFLNRGEIHADELIDKIDELLASDGEPGEKG